MATQAEKDRMLEGVRTLKAELRQRQSENRVRRERVKAEMRAELAVLDEERNRLTGLAENLDDQEAWVEDMPVNKLRLAALEEDVAQIAVEREQLRRAPAPAPSELTPATPLAALSEAEVNEIADTVVRR